MIDKIAHIATFHCVPNYGAVLQTYGLQQYLKTVFKEVRVLDYRPDALLKEYKNINCYSIGSIAFSLWSLFPFIAKKRSFAKFEIVVRKSFRMLQVLEKAFSLSRNCFR